MMKRREAIKSSLIVAGALSAGTLGTLLTGCKTDTALDWSPSILTKDQARIVEEAAERILPKTDTPGAKDLLVHRFIDNAVAKVMKPEEKDAFLKGLERFDAVAHEKYNKKFTKLEATEMDEVLTTLVKEGKGKELQIFPMLQQITKTAYFSSELISTEYLVYSPIPGPYKGCVSLDEVGGQLAVH